MRLGIGSYTFGWAVGVPGHVPDHPLDEQGLLDQALALGVSVVQFGDNLPLHTLTEARLQQLAARAARERLTLEVGTRGLTPEHLGTYLVFCHRLDSKLLRFVIDDAGYEPTLDEVIAILRGATPHLGETCIAIENHDRFPVRTLATIMDAVANPQIGICLDTANSYGAGEGVAEVVSVLAPYTLNLHVKDFTIQRVPNQMGFTITGCPAGAGMANVPFILEQLAPYERCHSAILELWPPPEATLAETIAKEAAWAQWSVEYLRGLGFDS